MFRTRLISGIVLVIIALVVVISGGPLLAAVLTAISLIGLNELYRTVRAEDGGFSPLAWVGYISVVLYYVLIWFTGLTYVLPLLFAALIGFMTVYVFTYPRYHINQVTGAFFGIIYVALMLSCIYLVRTEENGQYIVWLIFLASWGCDTCAYCAGMLFGKHKMAPVLSPKKTVEGAVGGVVGAALLGAIYAFAVSGQLTGSIPFIPVFAAICAAGGLISMVGDLAASAIKRNYEVKDYGKLIPGHGGILDRFDSVIFISPVIYYLSVIVQNHMF